MAVCSACGREVANDVALCPYCGTDLKRPTLPDAPEVSPGADRSDAEDGDKTMVGIPIQMPGAGQPDGEGGQKTMVGIPVQAPTGEEGSQKTMVGMPAYTPGEEGGQKTMVGIPVQAPTGEEGSQKTMVGVPAYGTGSEGDGQKTMVGIPVPSTPDGGDKTMVGVPVPSIPGGGDKTMVGVPIASAGEPDEGGRTQVMSPGALQAALNAGAAAEGMPALPALPFEVAQLTPPRVGTGFLAPLSYAFKTAGLKGKLKKSLQTCAERRKLLVRAREGLLMEMGQHAWNQNLQIPALEAHRDAIAAAQQQGSDLSAQIAALDAGFAEERQAAETETEQRNLRVEGLERQHRQEDQEYQEAAREAAEMAGALKDAEKRIAAAQKKIEKLQGVSEEKRAEDHDEQISEAQKEIALLESQLPAIRTSLEEKEADRERRQQSVNELRAKLKEERAAITETQRRIERRAREVEGQKAAIRGELAGTEEGLRGPFRRAGEEIFAARDNYPAFLTQFARLDALHAKLEAEQHSEAAYRGAADAFAPGTARKGWLMLFGTVAAIALLVVVIALFAGGRGGGKAGASGLITTIPNDVDFAAGVDVDGLLSAPVVKRFDKYLRGRLEGDPEYQKVVEALGVGPEDVEALFVGGTVKDHGAPDFLTAIKVDVDLSRLASFLKNEAGFRDGDSLGGATTLVSDEAIALLSEGLVLVAPSSSSALLEASPAAGGGASVADNGPLMAIVNALDTSATLWFAAVVPAEVAREMGDELPIAAGDRLGVSIDLSSGVAVSIHIGIDDEARAGTVEALLRKGLEEARNQVGAVAVTAPPVAMFSEDIKDVLGSVEIAREGSLITVNAAVPLGLIEKLADTFEPMLPMMMGGL